MKSKTGLAAGITGNNLTIHYGDVGLEIASQSETVKWHSTVGFIEFGSSDDEVIILGHGGCLDYFTAHFDGELAELELFPNSQFPS